MDDYFDEVDDVDPFANRPYDVGYGKPPKEHRFKKGNKAAAGRRRKRDKRIRETIFKRLNEKITVVAKGKRKRTTRMDSRRPQNRVCTPFSATQRGKISLSSCSTTTRQLPCH